VLAGAFRVGFLAHPFWSLARTGVAAEASDDRTCLSPSSSGPSTLLPVAPNTTRPITSG